MAPLSGYLQESAREVPTDFPPLVPLQGTQALEATYITPGPITVLQDVERQLCNTWLNHQEMKHFHLRKAFVQSYALQQRMLHFLQNVQHYMMNEV